MIDNKDLKLYDNEFGMICMHIVSYAMIDII